jgi:hypothetical protein
MKYSDETPKMVLYKCNQTMTHSDDTIILIYLLFIINNYNNN